MLLCALCVSALTSSLFLLHLHLIHVTPLPIFPRLNRLHDRMLRRMKMLGRVLILRRIATTHMPARKARPQVHPRISHLQAFLAAFGLRMHRPDFFHMRAHTRHDFLLTTPIPPWEYAPEISCPPAPKSPRWSPAVSARSAAPRPIPARFLLPLPWSYKTARKCATARPSVSPPHCRQSPPPQTLRRVPCESSTPLCSSSHPRRYRSDWSTPGSTRSHLQVLAVTPAQTRASR